MDSLLWSIEYNGRQQLWSWLSTLLIQRSILNSKLVLSNSKLLGCCLICGGTNSYLFFKSIVVSKYTNEIMSITFVPCALKKMEVHFCTLFFYPSTFLTYLPMQLHMSTGKTQLEYMSWELNQIKWVITN